MKQYKIEDKLWVLNELKSGRNRRAIAWEFYYGHMFRYTNRGNSKSQIIRRIERLFMDWEYLMDNYGMERLKKGGGNSTKGKVRGNRITSINNLSENDREVYQRIVEDILKDHGIAKSEITKKIREEKEKVENIKDMASVFKVNRTNIYYQSTKSYKSFSFNSNLLKSIFKLIYISRNSIGRDKAYLTLKNKFNVSSYVFRRHWESLHYKSNYRNKYRTKPLEKKYKGVWTSDKVNFNFTSNYEDEVWYSDITYIKVKKKQKMVLLIKDGFTKKVKFLEVIKDRKKETIIAALIKARKNSNKYPEIFHTDHGIEYANHKLKNFLNSNNIIQSMSPKGNSLANRPSEYFFSILKREFIYPFKKTITSTEILINTINDYLNWYHNYRVQRCLQNKTPYEFSHMMR